jgi:hypothetical protein
MPIDKFMIQAPQSGSGFPRLGKLHKGSEKQTRTRADGSQYQSVGKDLPYFRMAFAPEYEHLSADFAQLYGEEPTELRVMVHAETVLEALSMWYESWNSSGTMLHRCTGSNQVLCYNASTGVWDHNVPCAMPSCGCKAVARLDLILPDFVDATGEMATVTLETHSDADMRTLWARLSTFQSTYGTLRGVSMILQRTPREMSTPKVEKGKRTGERVKTTKSMIELKIDPEFARAKINAIKNSYSPKALPAAAQVVVSQDDAAKALSSGPKRLSAPTPALPAPSPEPEQAHWTAVPERWNKFLEWAEYYGYEEADVFLAMEEMVQRNITTSTDWALDKVAAMGAVIARAASYSEERIETFEVKGISSPDTLHMIRTDAKRVAKQWQKARDYSDAASAEPQPVDIDEIPF